MGEMPSGGTTFDGFDDITNYVNNANAILRATGRGYQFELIENTTVGGAATAYFNTPRGDKDDLESDAKDDPAAYKWRSNAINLYINNHSNSAICSFPDEEVLLFGQGARDTSLFHECGHYFNLIHTFAGDNCDDCSVCTDLVGGGDDGCADTLIDHKCWNMSNQVAQANYGLNYDDLDTGRQGLVDNTFFNIMSYHGTRDRLTSDQMDRWTDTAYDLRRHVVSGRTWFVDVNADCMNPVGRSSCGPGSLLPNQILGLGPFPTVAEGITAAGGGDIVLIRGGIYDESLTTTGLTGPVELRASRGNVIIQ
jgi:hypothetical protein